MISRCTSNQIFSSQSKLILCSCGRQGLLVAPSFTGLHPTSSPKNLMVSFCHVAVVAQERDPAHLAAGLQVQLLPLLQSSYLFVKHSGSSTLSGLQAIKHTEQMEAKKKIRYTEGDTIIVTIYLFIGFASLGGGEGILYGFWSLSHHLILRTTANKIIVYISVNIILGSTKNPGSLQVLLLSKTTRSYQKESL